MMTIAALMNDVHENAKAHGWWDKPRSERGARALIVSEWAEALEEARAGRLMVWHACKTAQGDAYANPACEHYWDCVCKMEGRKAEECPDYLPKPEGIAVELMDGCIRILDWLGHIRYDESKLPADMEHAIRMGRAGIEVQMIKNEETVSEYHTADTMPEDVLVDTLNMVTMHSAGGYGTHAYIQAMCIACAWVDANGFDPEKLIMEKHEYNKTRPYKHGKKF